MSSASHRLPEFVIIGAVKGATTWVAHQLRSQPGIFMPQREPHYFSSDYERGPSWYASLFDEAAPAARIGEKSADYLAHPDAARRLSDMLPKARLLVQLRNPVERAYSDYCMLFRRGTVDGDISHHLGPNGPQKRFLNDGLYWTHLSRWLEHFPGEQLHVLLYEDLSRDPQCLLSEVADFLRLGPVTPVAPAERKNDSKAAMLPLPIRKALAPLKPVVQPLRGRDWFQGLHRSLARQVDYPPLLPDLRRRLQGYYAADIEQLGRFLGRDLRSWVEPKRHAA